MIIATTPVTVGEGAMDMTVARPDGAERHPAVLVCHHRGGVDDFTRYALVRLSEIGLVAAAPNFYHRRPAGEDPVASLKHLDDNELVHDIDAAVAHLAAMPSVRADRIGTVGHCLGGRTSYLAVVHNPAFMAAALLYHGNIFEARGAGMVAPVELTAKIHGPVLGLFGADDKNPSPEATARLGEILTHHDIRHEFHTYTGTGHAFQDFHDPGHYRQASADDAWAKLLAFLRREML